MKRIILPLLSLTVAAAYAGPIDLGSRARLRAAGSDKARISAFAGAKRAYSVNPDFINIFIAPAPGHSVEELEAIDGLEIVRIRGQIAVGQVKADRLESLAANPAVGRISVEREINAKMNHVREIIGADMIHQGTGLPGSFTGKGVVAGIVDSGIDPNHVNFLNDDGTNRISHFTYFRPLQSGGYTTEKYGADYLPVIDTESDATYHGTHTLGIMAGSYRGSLEAAMLSDAGDLFKETISNPYYGIATEADLAVSCGAYTDYYIALGVESILDYAYAKDMPSVINLSLGSNVGPHDGTSLICQYLDQVSEQDRVICCLAAGNEGDLPLVITRTLTEEEPSFGSIIVSTISQPGAQNYRRGQTYIYSGSDEQFTVQAVIVNRKRNSVVMRMPLPPTTGADQYWVSSSEYVGADSDVVSEMLARYFEGFVGVGAEYDEASGRYYAVVDCLIVDNTEGPNADGDYLLGFTVTGNPGQRIDVYCDGMYNELGSMGLSGYLDAGSDGSISDVATGYNIVSVGSFNSHMGWASLDGSKLDLPETMGKAGEISPFSSYGTLIDGRHAPVVCAPGCAIISSSNQYYLDKYEVPLSEIQATLTSNGRTYSWHQSIGTSMASPVVAGSIALWLEANPTLKYNDVLEIIRKSSVVDEDVEKGNRVQWGAGKFNAYAGLKEALARANSISDINSAAREQLLLSPCGDSRFLVALPGETALSVEAYDAAGGLAAKAFAQGDELTLDLSAVEAGVYIIRANGRVSAKIVIR